MRPETMLQDCDHTLQELLPDQSRPVQKTLAAVLCGVVRARSVVLSRLGLHLPGRATASSKQRQAQRLVANAHLAVDRAQRRLLRRVLQTRRGRVDLLLDAVVRGASAQQAGTVSLVLGLAWHRRALPLVWHTWVANQPGQDWKPVIRALVAAVQAELLPDTQVVVLVDRGLSGAELARTVQATGANWHFLWRVTHHPHDARAPAERHHLPHRRPGADPRSPHLPERHHALCPTAQGRPRTRRLAVRVAAGGGRQRRGGLAPGRP